MVNETAPAFNQLSPLQLTNPLTHSPSHLFGIQGKESIKAGDKKYFHQLR